MIKRHLWALIISRLRNFPAVALLGPRQSGKTTLARKISGVYYDLEVEQERLRLNLQWDTIVESKVPVVLDEAQNYPEIFPRLRNTIDAHRNKNGRFLILGSVSPGLMKQVSEFLTGRLAICELAPFYLLEVKRSLEDPLWLAGGFPAGGILKVDQFPVWPTNYLDLLAMRDLPAWGLSASAQVTKRFFKMLAASHGTIWNASQIGKSMGLSYHTVNSYLDFLEQAYLIRRLQPYFSNIRKRLVKSPKIFWRDSGLLHALLGIHRLDGLLAQPWVGMSWEGWVIEQILTCLNVNGFNHEAFFLRTGDGYELDLVLKIRGEIWALEIKLSTTPSNADLERLKKTGKLIKADKQFLISRTNQEIFGEKTISTNLRGFLRWMTELNVP